LLKRRVYNPGKMSWLRTRKFKQSTLVFVLALCFLLGVGLAHKGWLIDTGWIWLVGLVAITSWRRHNVLTLIFVVLLGLTLGWWRGEAYMAKLADYQRYSENKITIIGTAANDSTYGKYQQQTFDVYNVTVDSTGERLTGKVGVSGLGFPAAYTGDTFRATGKLYLSRGSYQAKMSFAEVEITGHHNSLVSDLRRKFAAGMESALPEPLASFGMGLLIGQRANLPDPIYNELLMVGLVHIIAVSGYNLTIILRATEGLLKKHSKRLSTLLALALIGVFLLFAGGSASIVRAAIVSVLAIVAAYYGRKFKPLTLLTLAAAITAWANPFYVWTDVSWYLSFLAFFGVMIVAPLMLARLPKRLSNSLLITVAVESFCAELMTLPYVLHIFGQMSLIGLVANVLVVALVPLAMLLCMFAGLAGMLLPAAAGWFAFPARLLLTYMLDIAGMLSRIPHIFLQNLALSITGLLTLYALVAMVVITLHKKTKALLPVTITDEKTKFY
jgi:competence protein ComEC